MYDDNVSPYRCPLCLVRPSLCTVDARTKRQSVGCMTCNCSAPIFIQNENESKYMPLILWDRWVVRYRYEHPKWHEEYICDGCNKYDGCGSCEHYDENVVNCPNYEHIEKTEW